MEVSLLSQLFAAALAISQVNLDPAHVKTQFDPQADQKQVVEILRAGCKSSFQDVMSELGITASIADAGIDEALTLLVNNAQKMGVKMGLKDGLNLDAMQASFKLFCKGEDVTHPEIKLAEIISFYNSALVNLPDARRLKGLKLPQSTTILDVFGQRFTEIYKDDNRRHWVPIDQIPKVVQQAFIAAEDGRFFEHKGIDPRGIGRAFMNNMKSESGKHPEGGSTITQQVVKNLLVGDEVSPTRKIREIIVASRVEQILSKQEILELYLNFVFLGRASWGVDMAAQSYFGKSVKDITSPLEAALLAGMPKGPKYYNPDVFPERSKDRTAWVLFRMLKKNFIAQADYDKARADQADLKLVAFAGPQARKSFYFLDDILKGTAKGLGVSSLTEDSYVVKTTIHPQLQPMVEAAVQEGLAQFEMQNGRAKWKGPQKNIQDEISDFANDNPDQDAGTAWHKVLLQTRVPLYDVQWPIAVVVSKKGKVTVGIKDGHLLELKAWDSQVLRKLQLGDVVFVHLENDSSQGKKKKAEAYADLRTPPEVQGAAVVLENTSGRVLALTGGFSYVQSQFNRAVSMMRQPGSTVKPLTYLMALEHGIPTTRMIRDEGVSFAPILKGKGARGWSVGPGSGNLFTVRQGLEYSNNQVTARLLYEPEMGGPVRALDSIRNLCKEVRLCQGREPVRFYPFIIGAQEVRLIDLASFYSTIANEGIRAAPFFVESITKNGQEIFTMKGDNFRSNLLQIQSVRKETFHEMKSLLQGVLARGTARKLKDLAPFVGGKTGTTNDGNDTWMAGFTNNLTVAVWVGYDNNKRNLGNEATGGRVALPLFESIIRQTPQDYQEMAALDAPHPELAAVGSTPEREDRDTERAEVSHRRDWDDEDDNRPLYYDERQGPIMRPDQQPYYAPPPEDNEEVRERRRNRGRRQPEQGNFWNNFWQGPQW